MEMVATIVNFSMAKMAITTSAGSTNTNNAAACTAFDDGSAAT